MTGRTLNWYWKAMWAGVSPLLIISLFVFYLSDYILTGTLQYQAWDASQVPHVSGPPGSLSSSGFKFPETKDPLPRCGQVICCGLETPPGYLKTAQKSRPGL